MTETLLSGDVLIRKSDQSKWVFVYYENQSIDPYSKRIAFDIKTIAVRPLGDLDEGKIKTFPTDEFERAEQESFNYGDTILNVEDNSTWTFKRYKAEGISVASDWARENNWTGSQGFKRVLYATSLDNKDDLEEKEFLSRIFVKL